ncbi:MAG: hypothetical protein PWQ22_1125 [Archaeoglobaceae archaeon]|nr:hypothetical protein [Archaeoglobaceae archaeon]
MNLRSNKVVIVSLILALCGISAIAIATSGSMNLLETTSEDVTFYADGNNVFYNGKNYSDIFYYVRIKSPEYDYWNGTLLINSSEFVLEFPIGWEKLVKIYSDGKCFYNGSLIEEHMYTASVSSSSSSAKINPKIIKTCKYCLEVIFYKTSTSTSERKTYSFIGYIFNSCDPESYDFVQISGYGNVTQTPLKLVFR